MTLREKISDFCLQYNMLEPGVPVIACVSGGMDSMFLLHCLCEAARERGFPLFAAHFNHRLRGAESDGDEAFVRERCAALNVPLRVGSGDVAGQAKRRGAGIEETARQMRYAFFRELSRELGGAKIATAHNADDNLETVLMRIARGSGLRGLGGIPPVNGPVIRPILCLTRGEIQEYCRERGIPHREDSSNACEDYTRNLVRHKILPVMRRINPSLNVTELTGLLREDEAYLDSLARDFLAQREGPGGALPVRELLALPRPVSSRAIRRFCGTQLTAAHVDSVFALLESPDPGGSLDLPGLTLRREYGSLLRGKARFASFSPKRLGVDSPVIIEEANIGIFCRETVWDGEFNNSLTSYPIKQDKIKGELTVRPRAPGDVIRLAAGSRTLKKLFIDRHIPRDIRGLVPVIADSRGVVAVCGVGADRDLLARLGERAIVIEARPLPSGESRPSARDIQTHNSPDFWRG